MELEDINIGDELFVKRHCYGSGAYFFIGCLIRVLRKDGIPLQIQAENLSALRMGERWWISKDCFSKKVYKKRVIMD